MRRSVISAVVVLFLAASAFAQDTQRYLVATRGSAMDLSAVHRLYRNTETESQAQPQPRNVVTFQNVNAFAADLTAAEVAALKKSPDVAYIEPVLETHAFAATYRNFNGQSVPWGIDAVKARDAWAAGRGLGTNVVVIDTGVDYNHPDLKGAYAGGHDYQNNDEEPMDDAGHGSHVAGTIAAADDNNGVVGVAPNVRLWSVKVLNSEGTGTNDKVISALDWVISKKKELGGNWVINLSLGHSGQSAIERNAMARTIDAGIIVVAASGNDSELNNVKPVSYPAGYPDVITVGAVDSAMKVADFSNQGAQLELVAPGVAVLSSTATGFGTKSYVGQGNDQYLSTAVTGTPLGTLTGDFVFCGFGASASDYPPDVKGKIALVARGGDVTFAWKSRRAKEAGAVAVVIYNRPDAPVTDLNWGMRPNPNAPSADDVWTATYEYVLTVGMTYEDGIALKTRPTAKITASNDKDDYAVYQGTSMSSPHVAGAVALIWSLAPNATPDQVRTALFNTATDLGTPGQDPVYGFGFLNVFAAAKLLAPNAFGSAAQPTSSKPTTGRMLGKR